jgi:hypothetical protein
MKLEVMNDNQRTEKFYSIKNQLESEDYYGEKCTISILKANIIALITAGPIAVLCCIIFFFTKDTSKINFSIINLLIFYLLLMATIFIHELLHGLTWSLYCRNGWKSVHFGVIWKKLTPFCCCTELLNFKQYILGGLMPFIILGLGIFVISLMTNSIFLLVLSVFNIIAAGGDLTIAIMLLKHKDAYIIDHPTECGFWAFKKND